MLYKQDWDQTQERYKAWLAGENDRPLLQLKAPRNGVPQTHGFTGWNFVHDVEHPELAFEQYEQFCRQTYFGGEAIPNLFVNLGPGITAAYLGGPVDIGPDTVWFGDAGMSYEQILATRLDANEKWWRYTQRIVRMGADYAKDKFLISMTDLNGVMNVLGSLRGTQQLLIDVIEEPEQVTRAAEHIGRIWLACYDELYGIAQQYQCGMTSWMNIWGPGRFSDVQCDFSAMISPRMFEQFALPHLQEQCRRLDWSIYHWDGPGQIPHLDLLLDIPELDGIQWVPGAGRPGTGSPQWFGLYDRIQSKGKLLVLQGMDPKDVRGVVATLCPQGLLIEARCSSQDEAELLGGVERWARA